NWSRQGLRDGDHVHEVPLFGPRVARYRDFFDEVKFRRSFDRIPGYAGTGIVRAGVNLKRSLPETGDREYIAGFVDGWLAADGDPVKARSWRLRSISHGALAWVEKVAPYAGYIVIGSGEESNRETNFGVRNRQIRWLYPAPRGEWGSDPYARRSPRSLRPLRPRRSRRRRARALRGASGRVRAVPGRARVNPRHRFQPRIRARSTAAAGAARPDPRAGARRAVERRLARCPALAGDLGGGRARRRGDRCGRRVRHLGCDAAPLAVGGALRDEGAT